MALKRKSGKSNCIFEDVNELLNTSQFINSPMDKKKEKLTHSVTLEDESRIKTERVPQKNRAKPYFEATQKVLNVMDEQLTKRKKSNDNLLTSLSDILSEIKADDYVMTENEKNLEQLTEALMMSIEKSALARKQKLEKLEVIQRTYKTIFEDMYSEEKSQKKLVTKELNDDINKLQDKLIADAKRSGYEEMRKTIFHAIQNGFSI